MISRRLLQKRESWQCVSHLMPAQPLQACITQFSTTKHCQKQNKKLLEKNVMSPHVLSNKTKISTIAKVEMNDECLEHGLNIERPTAEQSDRTNCKHNWIREAQSMRNLSHMSNFHLWTSSNFVGPHHNLSSLVRTSRPGMLGVAMSNRLVPEPATSPYTSQNPQLLRSEASQDSSGYYKDITLMLLNSSPDLYKILDLELSKGSGSRRYFHTTSITLDSKPPSSQVEVTVNALKEKAESLNQEKKAVSVAEAAEEKLAQAGTVDIGAAVVSPQKESVASRSEAINLAIAETAPPLPPAPVEKKSIWTRVKEEVAHYYHGFRLLYIDTKLGIKYCYRILKGEKLSRREHRQLVRTTGDLFRLLPFSVFIIIPFMELLLPVALKLFPGMLPSTFETANEKEAKMKKRLKVKLEMAKFLQETLDSMSLQSKDHRSKSAKEFVLFFEKVRRTGEVVSNEEILKFSKLFADSITLDSLSRPQLTALCRLLEMQPFGTNNFLRFQLRMKLRSLVADDKLIAVEGVESLSSWELQQACRMRGMRAYGMTDARLRMQLKQWLELSLDKKVPPSLLLLSRTLYLPDTVDANTSLAATISQLPEEVKTRTKAAIGKREGKIDNRTRIEVLQVEEKRIEEDKKDMEEEKRKKMLEEAKKKGEVRLEDYKEELGIGEAEVVSVTPPTAPPGVPVPPDTVVATAVKVTKATVTPAGEIKEDKEELVDRAPVLEDKAEELSLGPQPAEKEAEMEALKAAEAKTLQEKSEELSSEDLAEVEEALETIGAQQRRLLIEEQELSALKGELQDYQEDIEDFKRVIAQVPERTDLRESKAARRLFAKVNRLIAKTEPVIEALNAKTQEMHKVVQAGEATKQQETTLVNLEDLVTHLRQVADAPDSAKLHVIRDVLTAMDTDHDGAIKLEHIMKTIELLSEDQVEVPRKLFEEVVLAMNKEEQLETKTVVQTAIKAVAARKPAGDSPSTGGVAEQNQG